MVLCFGGWSFRDCVWRLWWLLVIKAFLKRFGCGLVNSVLLCPSSCLLGGYRPAAASLSVRQGLKALTVKVPSANDEVRFDLVP